VSAKAPARTENTPVTPLIKRNLISPNQIAEINKAGIEIKSETLSHLKM
jgi:hypothetical protein